MKQSGFSLIEVMVVILIIGLMAAVVAPSIMSSQDTAKLKKAAVDIRQLESAMEMYKLRNSVYPTTEQGLKALVTKPTVEPIPTNFPADGFIKSLPKDPWGNDYHLLSPGEIGAIDIYSDGPDKQPGTDDDIGNWNVDKLLAN